MSNEVNIDEARLIAEADAALAASAPEVAPIEGEGAALAVPESWSPLIEGVTPMLRIAVFPQWNISDAESREFEQSLGQCLDQVFPGGLAGPYACWCRLIVCCGGIVATRAIQFGKVPPLGPVRRVQQSEEKSAAAS